MNISQRKQPVLFSGFPFMYLCRTFFCNLCIIMFFQPFVLQLCARTYSAACKSCSRAAHMLISKLLVMPPRTTQRIWMQGRSREKWERVALKEFSEGKWRGNFLRSLTCRSFIKLCVMMEMWRCALRCLNLNRSSSVQRVLPKTRLLSTYPK